MTIELTTADEAWGHFRKRVLANLRELAQTKAYTASMWTDDDALGQFIWSHPGAFEERLLASIPDLAASRWPHDPDATDLEALLTVDPPSDGTAPSQRNSIVDSTLRALRPAAGLRLIARARFQYPIPIGAKLGKTDAPLLDYFVRSLKGRSAPDELSPEMFHAVERMSPMPDILPADLDGATPRDIEVAIELYVDAPIEAIEARLRPGRASYTGFLGPDDRLGQVIWDDARRLRELGVDRHALADRLERAIQRHTIEAKRAKDPGPVWHEEDVAGLPEEQIKMLRDLHETRLREYEEPLAAIPEEVRRLPLEITLKSYFGFQEDPFHTRLVHTHSINQDFSILNRALPGVPALQGSMLAIPLIRRLCFFEGRVPYRIDPEHAARVLGLAP